MPSRNIYYVVAGLVVLLIAAYSLAKGHPPHTASEWLAPIGPAVTLAGIVLWLWDRFVWRWPIVRSIAKRPVLHGTWHGELKSDWIDPTTNKRVKADKEVFLVIRQRFWSLSARLLTKESKSYSLISDFKVASDGVHELLYVYSNKPRKEVQYRSTDHLGTVVLAVPKDELSTLDGHYFTDRRTGGELCFRKRFPQLVDSHAAGRALVASVNTPKK